MDKVTVKVLGILGEAIAFLLVYAGLLYLVFWALAEQYPEALVGITLGSLIPATLGFILIMRQLDKK